jgi:hypothetical protein
MFKYKETKDKDKDVQKIHQLATCAEKSGPYVKKQYESLILYNVKICEREINSHTRQAVEESEHTVLSRFLSGGDGNGQKFSNY